MYQRAIRLFLLYVHSMVPFRRLLSLSLSLSLPLSLSLSLSLSVCVCVCVSVSLFRSLGAAGAAAVRENDAALMWSQRPR